MQPQGVVVWGGLLISVQVAFPLYMSMVLQVGWCVVFMGCGNFEPYRSSCSSLMLQVEAQRCQLKQMEQLKNVSALSVRSFIGLFQRI